MSSLNPEALVFSPNVKFISESGYSEMSKGIRASNAVLNVEENAQIAERLQGIYRVLKCGLRDLTNKVLLSEETTNKMKRCKEKHNFDNHTEANDEILDSVNMDIESTDSRRPEKSNDFGFKTNACHVSSWNVQPTPINIKKMKEPHPVLRPQLKFKEKVDNSNKIFIPTLKDKPNAKTPLCLNIIYRGGEAVGYEHPYKYELKMYRPPEEFLNDNFHLMDFPKPIEESNFIYVDSEEQLQTLITDLTTAHEIAIDLEHHDLRTFLGFTCLIQISTNKTDYVIDALALRHCLSSLNTIFTDPNKLKIIHGSKNDILWLQKDFGVYVVGMYDTFYAARLLNFPAFSLKFLIKHYCNIDVDKTYQTADWRQRPLSPDLIKYARMDTHYLIYIWRATKKDLLQKNGGIKNLHTVFYNSKGECLQTYNKPSFNEKNLSDLLTLFNKTLNSSQSECFRRLFIWRDIFARKEDESIKYVLPDQFMIKIAEELPREKEGIIACCGSMVPPLVLRNINDIHKIILECRQLPVQPTLFHMPQGISSVLNLEERASMPVDETYQSEFREDTPTIQNNKLNFKNVEEEREPKLACFFKKSKCLESIIDKSGARSFSPPFERYKKYRPLAQIQEMREFQKKETKMMQAQKPINK